MGTSPGYGSWITADRREDGYTYTEHNIDYGIKVSQIDLYHRTKDESVFPTTPKLNYTVTKAAPSLQFNIYGV